ncbi:MAG TPA: sodium/proline symporter PutP [Pseudomonadales bacterium]|nr:sodium/proline symporter PutP [Pseudomonadales bacterium]
MLTFNATIASSFGVYMLIVFGIAIYAWRQTQDATDYYLGGRRLSPTVAALSAGASDTSGWILLGLPGYAYLAGLEVVWLSLGLCMGVALNWWLSAKRLRIFSHALDDAVTLPSYLQRRFADNSPWLTSVSALFIILFFLFYVSSGLIGGGKLFESVFGLDYYYAVIIGAIIVIVYTLFGGFLAVSWTDVFQGLLVTAALVMVPVAAFMDHRDALTLIEARNPHMLNLWNDAQGEPLTWIALLSLMGWGLGYFGQPHILSRFKAIASAKDIPLAASIGISWALLVYMAAIAVGMLGSISLPETLPDAEKVFIVMVGVLFHPLVAGLLLAAILAAIMSTIDSQLLVCSSSLAEDAYPLLRKHSVSSDERLTIGRWSVGLIAVIATAIALDPDSKVLDVVSYAWAGLGASLGPAILLSLYWRGMNRWGALAGMLVGGVTVIVWKQLSGGIFELFELVPGFVFSLMAIVLVSKVVNDGDEAAHRYDALKQQL